MWVPVVCRTAVVVRVCVRAVSVALLLRKELLLFHLFLYYLFSQSAYVQNKVNVENEAMSTNYSSISIPYPQADPLQRYGSGHDLDVFGVAVSRASITKQMGK